MRLGPPLVGLGLVVLAGGVPLGPSLISDTDAPATGPHVKRVTIESHDGVPLDGRVVFPRDPAERGEKFPVMLWSSPYAGTLLEAHVDQDPENQTAKGRTPLPLTALLEAGYAVAGVNVRGTGDSGGCYDVYGSAEQADQEVLVDWAAGNREDSSENKATWSTGNVAMVGRSADAIAALWGAVSGHPALKTIVVTGIVTDFYTAAFSPQGAVMDDQFWSALAPFHAVLALGPPRPGLDPPPVPGEVPQNFELTGYLGSFPARLCRELAEDLVVTAGDTFARDSFQVWRKRSAAWYEERQLLRKLDSVKAAVLLYHGFQDHLVFEEDRVWEALTSAPKWQWEGQWGHASLPMYTAYPGEVLVPWLDYWLKGGAKPSNLGKVSYQLGPRVWQEPKLTPNGPGADDDDEDSPTLPYFDWKTTTAWPPAEAKEVALRLARGGLRETPSTGSRYFYAVPDEAERQLSIEPRNSDHRDVSYAPPCPGTADGGTRLVYESRPVAPTETMVIAGNPSARLLVTSSGAGGTFSVQLFDLGPDFGCDQDGKPTGYYRFLTEGGVDLRFLSDRYTPTDFPVGQQREVRVDLASLAEKVKPGNRLAVVLSLGPQKARVAQGYFPKLDINGWSRLLLPVVEGAFEADEPSS